MYCSAQTEAKSLVVKVLTWVMLVARAKFTDRYAEVVEPQSGSGAGSWYAVPELAKAMASNSGLSSTLSCATAARGCLGHLRKRVEWVASPPFCRLLCSLKFSIELQ
jgi:hypothetical protein